MMIIALTLVIALMLSIVPLPSSVVVMWPDWVALVMIYWAMALPHRVSIGVAWGLGLLLDTLVGTLLGEHALALIIIIYGVIKLHVRLRLYPLWQQAVVVFFLLCSYRLVIFWMQGLLNYPPQGWQYWCTPVIDMLLWPWLYYLLRAVRKKFNVV